MKICKKCTAGNDDEAQVCWSCGQSFEPSSVPDSSVEIKGNKLTCPVCKGQNFWKRQTLMNTRGSTFLGFDWANKQADNYVCHNCGYVFWFFERR